MATRWVECAWMITRVSGSRTESAKMDLECRRCGRTTSYRKAHGEGGGMTLDECPDVVVESVLES